ncbi:proton-conducting transporter membrane subunit [Candidatus Sulfurimonas baltica]|uniref:Pesticidal protein Cry5Ba n=1 Tax=Candidatus Sulfurimonas baltica TaxID=2740404 RepID=A0A7S7RNV0_9BACT|nr:proton-conducting transporter membrane subunit [Candidatus Sulfurimonas baltica]QOY52916.1 pesticidal protein Cry5Ba [Candidatus Sulfurimonas baltica]
MYNILIISPLLFALIVLMGGVKFKNILIIFFVGVLSILSLLNMFFATTFVSNLSHMYHKIFILIDTLLLLYFLAQGIIKKNHLVSGFAIVQILLYSVVLSLSPTLLSNDILVDNISSVMYLVINIVGGIIIIYAIEYIKSEEFSEFKKNAFIAILFLFLSVMNFIVSTNNIEIFFMLFELTTLCSFILIGYRGDKTSSENALKALWMNQIGGVAILIALIFSIHNYNTIYFDMLITNINELYLLPIVFLAIAGFVKGASIPFEKWLLGAMVAPTPVSAILHSATMVKIAPYLMLKLAPAMSGFVSVTITLIGTFVFFSASLLALSKDYFKEILGLSTIALLALMMSLAAIATEEAIMACLILIVFHAVSKALLFLQAGILEKSFHLKYVNDINGLINHSPLVVFFIIIGFASLTLPPFGAFAAKFMAIESIAKEIVNNPLYSLALIFVALGSVFLTLLYFKVVTKLFAKDVDHKEKLHVKIPKLYTFSSYMLLALLFIGVYVSFDIELLSALEIIVPLVLIAVIPMLFAIFVFKKAHRVKEYHCGEKDEVKLNMYYFDIPQKYKQLINVIAISSILILIAGVIL